MSRLGAIEAAEHYRRSAELKRAAQIQLVAAVIRERDGINLRGIARTAGVWEQTLYRWIEREAENGDGPETPR